LAGVIASAEGKAWRPLVTTFMILATLLVAVTIWTAVLPVKSWISKRLPCRQQSGPAITDTRIVETAGHGSVSPMPEIISCDFPAGLAGMTVIGEGQKMLIQKSLTRAERKHALRLMVQATHRR
jgi:hypothetical protein